MRLAFTVFGIPAGQGSMTVMRSKTTGKGFAKHPKKTIEWRRLVAIEAVYELGLRRNSNYRLMDGALSLSARFYFPRPKSAPKRRTRPSVQPDLDKLVRALGDALEGVAYRNDSQIVELAASKHYGEPARVEVVLEEIGDSEEPRGKP